MKYQRNEPLNKHTSFCIGGPADYFCRPKTMAELKAALTFARENKLPIAVMGAGTNLLVLDQGFRGLVIKFGGGLNRIQINGCTVQAGAGALIGQLLKKTLNRRLAGLEFMAGIPGTLGGAVVMNAGARGFGIGQFVQEVKLLNQNGERLILTRRQLKFGYRSSRLQKNKLLVVEVVLRLRKGKTTAIKSKIRSYLEKRRDNQPLGIPNAGSIFKNPPGRFAGQLLEEAGCKGLRFGKAQVSARHANIILNLGKAKASDVIKLVRRMQNLVRRKFKVRLEPELKVMVQSKIWS